MALLLLVDNDARIVELTAWFLERLGHQVRSAGSYADARALMAAEGPPDLMLADLELGVESGREELPRLSRQGELPPTLVVSGYLDAELRRELIALPSVFGTLAKPFDMPELEVAIADCLERARQASGADASSALGQGGEPSGTVLSPPVQQNQEQGTLTPVAPPVASTPSVPRVSPEAAELEEEDEDDGWIEILPGALPTSPPGFGPPRS